MEETTCSALLTGHIINEDGHPVLHIADQDHGGDFVGPLSLFVNECKVHIEAIGDGRNSARQSKAALALDPQIISQKTKDNKIMPLPFGSTSVWRDDNTGPPVSDIVLYPLDDGRLGEQVIHRNVKKSLYHKLTTGCDAAILQVETAVGLYLNLGGMQVHCDDVVSSSDGQHVGNKLGRYGRTRLKRSDVRQRQTQD